MYDKIFAIVLTMGILSHVAALAKSKEDLIEELFGPNGDNKSETEQPVTNTTPNLTSGSVPGTDSCTCVPYYRCKKDSEEESLIDIIVDEHPCENYLDICCKKGNIVDVPTTPTTTPPPTQ